MGSSIKARGAVVVTVAALVAAIYPITGFAAAAPVHVNGSFAVAFFEQVDETGCIVTEAMTVAAIGRTAGGSGSSLFEGVEAFIVVTDVCESTELAFLACSSFADGTADVVIDRQLLTATAEATMMCADLSTAETCTLTSSETFQANTDSVVGHDNFVERFEGLVVVEVSHGEFRGAALTTASISGCGVSLTEEDAVGAGLFRSNDTSVQVYY
jgi:hypothetical protein